MDIFLNLINNLIDSFFRFGSKILDSIFNFVIIFIVYRIVCKVFKSIFHRKVFNDRLDKSHSYTIESLILSIIKYSFITIMILILIQNFVGAVGITITSIIGVALGFASQSIIKDLLNGILITFENQFTVGDYISINKGSDNFSGIVDAVQARVTKLKDFNGDYHIIPNGFINQVTNHSRKDSRILIDIKVAVDQKSSDVVSNIERVLNSYKNENITVKPYIYGVIESTELGITYRIMGYAKPLSHWGIENELRKLIMDELISKNILLPSTRYSIVNK